MCPRGEHIQGSMVYHKPEERRPFGRAAAIASFSRREAGALRKGGGTA